MVDAVDGGGRALPGHIYTQLRDVSLPLDITPTAANIAAVRAAFAARMLNPDGQPVWYQKHAESMIARIDSATFATSVPNPSQVWKVGSPVLKMAFVGGELVSGYAAYFRTRHGGANGLYIGGYANEMQLLRPREQLPAAAGAVMGQLRGRLGCRQSRHRGRQHDGLPADRALPRRQLRGRIRGDLSAQRAARLNGEGQPLAASHAVNRAACGASGASASDAVTIGAPSSASFASRRAGSIRVLAARMTR